MQAVKNAIVAGITDDRELRRVRFRGETFDELGAAGAAGENN
jgi:hypothetical protein